MLNNISSVLWIVTTLVIILSGIFFSFYLKFPQLKLSNSVNISDKKDSIKLLNLILAGKIGVGSISGIAIAIIIGGKGSIIWIWISTIFITIFTYLEVKTGIKYREKVGNEVIGGPPVYIKKELKKNKLSNLYILLVIFTYLIAFILIQSNTLIIALFECTLIDYRLITILLILLIIISTSKGITTISKIVSFLVPIMGLIYILIGIIILIRNIQIIPSILYDILKESIHIKSLLSIPFIVGFQRSIFSNESGMGITSIVISLSNSNNYKKEYLFQLLGTLFITLIICSISALIILTTDYNSLNFTNLNGIEIINYAFNYHFGQFGLIISTIIISLFAFSTIITSYYYGDICYKYLFNIKITKLIVIIVVISSVYISSNAIWSIVDISTALITLINIYALFKIRNKLKE